MIYILPENRSAVKPAIASSLREEAIHPQPEGNGAFCRFSVTLSRHRSAGTTLAALQFQARNIHLTSSSTQSPTVHIRTTPPCGLTTAASFTTVTSRSAVFTACVIGRQGYHQAPHHHLPCAAHTNPHHCHTANSDDLHVPIALDAHILTFPLIRQVHSCQCHPAHSPSCMNIPLGKQHDTQVSAHRHFTIAIGAYSSQPSRSIALLPPVETLTYLARPLQLYVVTSLSYHHTVHPRL